MWSPDPEVVEPLQAFDAIEIKADSPENEADLREFIATLGNERSQRFADAYDRRRRTCDPVGCFGDLDRIE